MKKNSTKPRKPSLVPEMLSNYDFKKGVRGKHARRYAAGANLVKLDPDIASSYPDSQAVNGALRALDQLLRSTARRRRK